MNALRLTLVAVLAAACASNDPNGGGACGLETLCGEGTVLVGSECRGSNMTVCGDGTSQSGDACLANVTGCGPGTVLKNRQCLVPTADPNVASFIARTVLNESGDGKTYSSGSSGLSHHVRHVWTELPASDARSWGAGESPMIGNGLALHLALDTVHSGDRPSGSSITFTQTLTNLTQGDGSCLLDVAPKTAADRFQLAVWQWTAGGARAVACAKTGSVTISYNGYSYGVEVNAVLGDGTVVRKTFSQSVTN